MYTKESVKQLQKESATLLKKQATGGITAKDIVILRDVLRFHEYRYYVENDPLLADVEYDQLYKSLEKLEAAEPLLVTPDSPTQRVARGLTRDFPTVQHLVPML